jgi:tRNA threonylcarbamoyladenosine biosynthesis protein TsaE
MSASAEETEAFGVQFGKTLERGAVVSLDAPLGAGKTVFARGIARGLGIDEPVTSPTYTIANEYELPGGGRFYHLDAYRLSGAEDFEAIGGGEFFDGGAITVIEWGSRLSAALPRNIIKVEISIHADGKRAILFSQS